MKFFFDIAFITGLNDELDVLETPLWPWLSKPTDIEYVVDAETVDDAVEKVCALFRKMIIREKVRPARDEEIERFENEVSEAMAGREAARKYYGSRISD